MSTPRSPFFAALALCGVLLACAKSSIPENSSETHFLARCDGGCGAGLDCVCGVCTESCDVGDSCTHLSADARCVAADDASCTQERSCDVECERDADCSALGERTCEAGRCREPVMSIADSGAMDASADDAAVALPAPDSCDTDGLIALLVEGEHVFCAGMPSPDAGIGETPPDAPGEATRACVEDAMTQGSAFLVFSTAVGTDSVHGGGYLGFRDGDAWKVYDLEYDSFGYGAAGGGVSSTHAEPLWWTPCMDFRVNASCDDGCFTCETDRYDACGCGIPYDGDGPIRVRCLARDLPPCEQYNCELDGVCYTPDDFFGDTSYRCICTEDGRHCEGNDEDGNALGRRCGDNGDCDPSHACRTDLAGGPGVCMRSCGPGCPTDADCVEDPGGPGIDPVGGGICLRTCDESAGDCSESDLGSECKPLDGSAQTYCL